MTDEPVKPHCLDCLGEVRPNVPRLGWDAGFVHLSTGTMQCPTEEGREKQRKRAQKSG